MPASLPARYTGKRSSRKAPPAGRLDAALTPPDQRLAVPSTATNERRPDPRHTHPVCQLNIEYVPVGQLKPAAYHPRRITDDELAALGRSIQEFGFADPVIVRRVGLEVIGGHQRVVAAKRIGLATVPVVFLDVTPNRATFTRLGGASP